MKVFRNLCCIALAAGLTACAGSSKEVAAPRAAESAQIVNTAPQPAAPPAAPAVITNEVHWVRNSAEHDAAFFQAYRQATEQIEKLAEGRERGTWAVSLDADETVIDNSQFQKEIILAGKRFNLDLWNAWCRREEAKPLPGAVEFMERVQDLGGVVAIVTNRGVEVQPETESNFRKEGIPFDIMLCKANESDKNPRYQALANGTASADHGPLEVLMWVGDNIEDFPDTTQSIRDKGEGAYDDFGERFIVLPNPMYGSWERNERD